jgi:tetratricopeptide (TPR) repeat protein
LTEAIVKRLCACVLFCLVGVATASSQAPLHSTGDDAQGLQEQVSKAAAQIQRERTEFVSALLRFIEAIGGSFGDEGPALSSNVDAMARALVRWDKAIQTYRSILTDGAAENPNVHVALAAVYLERSKGDEALKEAVAASRLDPFRPDAYILQALAYDLGNRPGAAQVLEKAASLSKANPAIAYELARRLGAAGDNEGARTALQKFSSIVETSIDQDSGARNPTTFVRAGLLRQSAGIAPMFPPSGYVEGFRLLAQGAYEKAIAEFEQGVRRDPLNHAETSQDDDMHRGAIALRHADPQRAIALFKAATQRFPNRAEPRRMLGLSYKADEQFTQSIQELTAAVALDAADERARSSLADVLVLAERFGEAEHVLKEAIDAFPRSSAPRYQLAFLYQSRGRNGDALSDLQAAANVEPILGQDALYDTLGILYMSNADLDGALAAYHKRVNANPNSSDAHRKLGQIYLEQSRYDEARAEFAAAVLLDPRNSEAHAGRAQAFLRMGEFADAEMASRRALALNQAHVAARYALGTSLVRLGRIDEGSRELDEFQRLQTAAQAKASQDWELKLIRQSAQAAMNEGDLNRAAALLNRAASIESDVPSNYTSLGLVLERAGRHAEAIDAFRKALEKRAGPEVHRYLARAYAAAGRQQESEAEQDIYNRAKRDRMLEGNRGR